MAHEVCLTVSVKLSWWVRPYLLALLAFSELTGLKVDAEKAADLVARRGMRFDVA
jgi:hypothetical protein